MPRVTPLEPPFEPAVAASLHAMMPPGIPPIALFRTMARNLPMVDAMRVWGAYELGRDLSLSTRHREIVIDRTCARCGCEYEWGVHVSFFAERADLTEAQVRSLTHGDAHDPCWPDSADRVLIDAVDSLHDLADVDDELWSRLSAEFDEKQVLDILLLCGWYHAISYVARAARVPFETDSPQFDDFRP